ncbi:MAG: nuclear transport factor 2 family protein [Bacteroidetes bacterium]|nr:MAG: nuclear transport factor 2 family protein [Bacteroidota bacterium]
MTTQEVAKRLAVLCRQGQYEQAQQELYAPDALSLEPAHSNAPETKGLDAIRKKGEMFQSSIREVHSGYVSEPMVAGNFITLTMGMDITMQDGNRMSMDEVAVYEVKDGKVVREQFFF